MDAPGNLRSIFGAVDSVPPSSEQESPAMRDRPPEHFFSVTNASHQCGRIVFPGGFWIRLQTVLNRAEPKFLKGLATSSDPSSSERGYIGGRARQRPLSMLWKQRRNATRIISVKAPSY